MDRTEYLRQHLFQTILHNSKPTPSDGELNNQVNLILEVCKKQGLVFVYKEADFPKLQKPPEHHPYDWVEQQYIDSKLDAAKEEGYNEALESVSGAGWEKTEEIEL